MKKLLGIVVLILLFGANANAKETLNLVLCKKKGSYGTLDDLSAHIYGKDISSKKCYDQVYDTVTFSQFNKSKFCYNHKSKKLVTREFGEYGTRPDKQYCHYLGNEWVDLKHIGRINDLEKFEYTKTQITKKTVNTINNIEDLIEDLESGKISRKEFDKKKKELIGN